MDSEGNPTQELSAILVDDNWKIVDVYHAYAACRTTDDSFCRRHLHGLEVHILHSIGFPHETALTTNFQQWLASKSVDNIFANDPKKERQLFPNLCVQDVGLPVWVARVGLRAYQVALEAKRFQLPIKDTVCGSWVHGAFQSAVRSNKRNPTDTDMLKIYHGFHCSLYDSYMIYLYMKDINL